MTVSARRPAPALPAPECRTSVGELGAGSRAGRPWSAPAGLLLGLAALLGSACTRAPESSRREQREAASSFEDSAATLRLAGPPTRIVPSSARALEFLADLVGPARIAALPEQAFEYATLGADEEAFARLPRFYAYLAETLLALEPDLVLGDPWQAPETNQRLREAGVPVLVLPETVTWRESRALLVELGELLECEDAAARVAADLERRVAALSTSSGARAGLRVLSYSNFGSQGFSAGSGTTIDEVITLAGMHNAAAEGGRRGHGPLGFEELLLLDPDVIVVSAPLATPVGHAGDRGGAAAAVLASEPALSGLRAVREARIVNLPAGLFACASHRVVDAAERLADEVDALRGRLAGAEMDGAR